MYIYLYSRFESPLLLVSWIEDVFTLVFEQVNQGSSSLVVFLVSNNARNISDFSLCHFFNSSLVGSLSQAIRLWIIRKKLLKLFTNIPITIING